MSDSTVDLSIGREIRHVRVFDAPRELVWKALTDPAHVDVWWGPDGFTNVTAKNDFRVGGSWVFTMRGPDGTEYPNAVTYREIAAPERFAFRHGQSEEENPDADFNTVITLEDLGGRTRPTMTAVFKDQAARDAVIRDYGALEGGKQHLEKLADHLERMAPDFVISRTFDAPQTLVWRALTEPEHMAKWFGPKGFTGKTHRMDMRPGGIYHYSLTGEDGSVMWGRWVYREISPTDRLVFVQSFSDAQGGLAPSPFPGAWPLETLSTFTLSEQNGRTTFTVRWAALNASPEETASFTEGFGHMTIGWNGTFDQLAGYLKSALA